MAALGTDIVRIDRIEQSLRRFGERFVRRVFSPREAEYCDGRSGRQRSASYATRFAAKEAVIKALGATEVGLADVEVFCDTDGRPTVVLHGRAAAAAGQRRLASFSVSMSRDHNYAMATAVALPAVAGPGMEAGMARGNGQASERACRVRLLGAAEAATPRIREIYRIEEKNQGQVRNLTRVTAHSPAAWQITTRALEVYDLLRRLDRPLVDLLCLYVSLLNGCRYCVDDAAGEALRSGWLSGQLLALGGRPGDGYPPATAAALRYAEALTRRPGDAGGRAADELRRYYDDEALVELTMVIGLKNFWNRFASALRIPAEGKCADHRLFGQLLELSQARWSTEEV